MADIKQNFWMFGLTRIYPIILALGLFGIGAWIYLPKSFNDWVWYFFTVIAFGMTIAISYAWITDYKQYKQLP